MKPKNRTNEANMKPKIQSKQPQSNIKDKETCEWHTNFQNNNEFRWRKNEMRDWRTKISDPRLKKDMREKVRKRWKRDKVWKWN